MYVAFRLMIEYEHFKRTDPWDAVVKEFDFYGYIAFSV